MSRKEDIVRYGLAIETSSALGSVAVGRGEQILGTAVFTRPRSHAIEFFPAIDALCRQHHVARGELSHVYVSAGPGSFTGLRVGITAARTLAFATGARIVAVPTLEVIAQNAAAADPPPATVAVVLDAKRGHVYAATFRLVAASGDPKSSGVTDEVARYRAMNEPSEADPADFLARQERSCVVLGEGVLYHGQAVVRSGLRVLAEYFYRPRAEIVYRLGAAMAADGQWTDPRCLIPIYIRAPEAQEKWERQHGGASR